MRHRSIRAFASLGAVIVAVSLSGCGTVAPLTRLESIQAPLPVADAAQPADAPSVREVLSALALERVEPPDTGPSDPYVDPEQASVQHGIASFYGGKFHGRTTASGEPYNMHALTAAHRTLPLGTRLRVTNLANNRDVELTVNDRGPYAGRRVIDLSLAAARKLGFVRQGLTPVRIDVLSPARASAAPAEPAPRGAAAAASYRPASASLGIASTPSPGLAREAR